MYMCSSHLYDDDDWLIAGSLQLLCGVHSLSLARCICVCVCFTGCSAKGVASGDCERHVICLNRAK